jgi:hypothetical protein
MLKPKLPQSIKGLDLSNKRTRVLGILVVLVIIAGAGVFFINKTHGHKLYAQAAGHKIYEKEVKDLIGTTKGVSDHQAAQVLADKYMLEALAKENNISVSDKELKARYNSKQIDFEKANDKFIYQSKLNGLYFEKLSAWSRGVYKGEYLITNFSRYIPFEPVLPENKADKKLGNMQLIAQDRKYAEDLINKLYDQVTSGKMTFAQAIQEERGDSRVGAKAYPTMPHSGSFNTSAAPNSTLEVASIKDKVHSLKAGETSKPFAVKVSVSADDSKQADSYFLVVHMDKSSAGSKVGYDQYIVQAKQRLGYAVYV